MAAARLRLLRLLTGSLQPSAGNISYLGQALSACRYDYLSDMLYIGHQPAVKLNLSAEENLRWMVATSAQSNDLSVTDALTQVGLSRLH